MVKRTDESGIVIAFVLLIVTLVVFGLVVMNSINKSREAKQNEAALESENSP